MKLLSIWLIDVLTDYYLFFASVCPNSPWPIFFIADAIVLSNSVRRFLSCCYKALILFLSKSYVDAIFSSFNTSYFSAIVKTSSGFFYYAKKGNKVLEEASSLLSSSRISSFIFIWKEDITNNETTTNL